VLTLLLLAFVWLAAKTLHVDQDINIEIIILYYSAGFSEQYAFLFYAFTILKT
jgi:hypothetical protein